jgi:hypothetical protein
MVSQEAFFEDLFMNATALAIVTDREGSVMVCNNRASGLLVGNRLTKPASRA